MNCVFCDSADVRSRMIYTDQLVMVFPTNIPIVPGHVLVCPVRHVATVEELTDEEWNAIRAIVIRLKAGLKKCFDAEGFNLAWNEGTLAGQSVGHFHLHLLPRKTGDGGIVEYDPRKFLYRPGSREVSPDQELQEVAILIKASLQ